VRRSVGTSPDSDGDAAPTRQEQDMTTTIDVNAHATAQGGLWGRQPLTWAAELEPQMQPLYDATLDALGPLAGLALLDAGCGSGLALGLAAARGAVVSGHDASEELLAVARERAPDARLSAGSIEVLPHAAATFDVVMSYNAIQYAVDPSVAVLELARVTRAGGRVAIGIWGDPARCETEALFGRLRALAPPPPGTAAPLACSSPGVVEDLLARAGLTVTDEAELSCPFTFRDLDHAWTSHTSAGPLQKVIGIAGEDAVREVMDAVLEADRKPDGQLRQHNVFRYVIAMKP
jgi:SAM-dependent methyltransferase